MFIQLLILVLVIICITVTPTEAKLREGSCEVCMNVMKTFGEIVADKKLKNQKEIETAMKEQCKTYIKGSKERRFCYYIGADVTSASGFLRDISKPLSFGLPTEKLCERAKKKDAAVCELAYDKPIDLDAINLNTLRVKELKKILTNWGEECKGCTAKSDFINLINDKRSLHEAKKEL